MTKMTFEQMAEVEGGRFLGWGWHEEAHSDTSNMQECGGCAGYISYQSYDVFGIGTGITREVVKCLAGCI